MKPLHKTIYLYLIIDVVVVSLITVYQGKPVSYFFAALFFVFALSTAFIILQRTFSTTPQPAKPTKK